jgi:hypothetical protein
VSPDGTKLGWTETVVTPHDNGEFGQYLLHIADLVAASPPRLANGFTVDPGDQSGWREFGGFLPGTNNNIIIGSGDIKVDQLPQHGDVFRYNIATQTTVNLTPLAAGTWDETIHSNEDGTLLAWHSSIYLDGTFACLMFGIACADNAKTEYWVMAPLGGNKRRLTYFNEPGSAEYTGENTVGTNICWEPGHTDRGLVSVLLGQSRGHRIYRFVMR